MAQLQSPRVGAVATRGGWGTEVITNEVEEVLLFEIPEPTCTTFASKRSPFAGIELGGRG